MLHLGLDFLDVLPKEAQLGLDLNQAVMGFAHPPVVGLGEVVPHPLFEPHAPDDSSRRNLEASLALVPNRTGPMALMR